MPSTATFDHKENVSFTTTLVPVAVCRLAGFQHIRDTRRHLHFFEMRATLPAAVANTFIP